MAIIQPQLWEGYPLLGDDGYPVVDPDCCCPAGVQCLYCIGGTMPPHVTVEFKNIANGSCGSECQTFDDAVFELTPFGAGEWDCWYNLVIFGTPGEFCDFDAVRFFIHAEVDPGDPTDFGIVAQLFGAGGLDYVNFTTSFSNPDQYPIDCNPTEWVIPFGHQSINSPCSGIGATATVIPKWT